MNEARLNETELAVQTLPTPEAPGPPTLWVNPSMWTAPDRTECAGTQEGGPHTHPGRPACAGHPKSEGRSRKTTHRCFLTETILESPKNTAIPKNISGSNTNIKTRVKCYEKWVLPPNMRLA